MNDIEIKKDIVRAVKELRPLGVGLAGCASALEISKRTLQRWFKDVDQDRRKGSKRNVPHKLTKEEQKPPLSERSQD